MILPITKDTIQEYVEMVKTKEGQPNPKSTWQS